MTFPFRAILAFHAVARSGSMLYAARNLEVTPSAVSQQVKILEEQMGTRLFNRVGKRLILTEAGERYLEMIGDEIDRVLSATDQMRGRSGRLSLFTRIAPTFGTKWLLPRLERFIEAHPEIDIRIDATNDPPDFEKENFDLEIRHGAGGGGAWKGLLVEPLVRESFLPLCSPDLLASGSASVEALMQYPLITSVKNVVQWKSWFETRGHPVSEVSSRLFFDRAHMSIDMAASGAGIVLESTLTAWKELEQGRLCCPLANVTPEQRYSLWYVCPRSHLNRRVVRLFMEWMAKEIENMPSYEGSVAQSL